MLKVSHSKLVAISGVVWFLVGIFLLQYGVQLLVSALPQPVPFVMWTHPLLEILAPYVGSRENVAVMIVLGCLVTGNVKCHFVLSRSINRGIHRILALPNPAPVYKIYSLPYYFLIASMIALGFLLRNTGAPADFRAACYLSIGFGMVRGSMIYLWYGMPFIRVKAR
ncbi:MAG: hypothetical protein K940chlam3_00365 [Chlamydiae bacterium]|nr:hypothetical protein [Chlamydiota bacterium]